MKNLNKTYIIAEVGPNHNGSYEMAREYVEQLSVIGVDAIKFQISVPENLLSLDSFQAKYQKENSKAKSALEMSKSLQLTREQHVILAELCKEKGVDYLCSAFEYTSIEFLDKEIDVPYFKIPSGEIFSVDIIEYISNRNKPVILSSGMASYAEIETALDLVNQNFKKDIVLLHCVSKYPAEAKDINLSVMLELKQRFGIPVGYSDHTVGNEAAIAAVALGARVVEKHVTLDKSLPGPDHKASATVDEFAQLVKSIRQVEKLMGSNEKLFTQVEKDIKKVARKSIVAKRTIEAGEIVKLEDICFKRPGIGYLPIEQNLVVGRKAKVKISENRVIKPSDIE